MDNYIEILAPAGNINSLIAGIRCGANAVYVGGKLFSARNNAENFTLEELQDAIKLCHLYGVKIYLTVNIAIFDSEIIEFCEYIKNTASMGIDAFIVQDFGVAVLIKKCVPNAILHASTQMTIHSLKGLEFAKSMGFSRIVPARELSYKQIKTLTNHGVEIEAFVHGALCMSVSGECYISAMIGSRSANRGKCGQACRLPFSVNENKDFCGLSLKDLCLANHTDMLIEAGVNSFKIEGRMKRPEYVASAVNEYKKALNGDKPDISLLRSVFSRDGFTDGYFLDKRVDMFGSRLKKDVVATKDILPEIREAYHKEPKLYKINFKIYINSSITLIAECNNFSVSVCGGSPLVAIKRSIDLETIEKYLSKLGGTIFEYGSTYAEIDEGLTVQASVINELRRKAINSLSDKIIFQNTPIYNITDFKPNIPNISKYTPKKTAIYIQCKTAKQALAVHKFTDMIMTPVAECLKAIELGVDKEKICVVPPRFIVDESIVISELSVLRKHGISHLLCVNPAFIVIGKELEFDLHGGFGLNITNSYSAKFLADSGLKDITLSFELKISQLKKIDSPIPKGIIVYGKLPLMLTRNCPIKNESSCKNCKGTIVDRTNREFSVNCEKDYVEILNSETLSLSDYSDIFDFDFITLMLNDESPKQSEFIARTFSTPEFKVSDKLTKGLYYRGIS